jgi:hypothetical protein
MSARRRCRQCGRQFTPERGTNRINCFECHPSRKQSPPVATVAQMGSESDVGSLEAAHKIELAASGRLETPGGRLVLYLARQLDGGGHTGSQTAALAARLMEAHRVAMSGATATGDRVNELEERRRRRASGL